MQKPICKSIAETSLQATVWDHKIWMECDVKLFEHLIYSPITQPQNACISQKWDENFNVTGCSLGHYVTCVMREMAIYNSQTAGHHTASLYCFV